MPVCYTMMFLLIHWNKGYDLHRHLRWVPITVVTVYSFRKLKFLLEQQQQVIHGYTQMLSDTIFYTFIGDSVGFIHNLKFSPQGSSYESE